MKKSYHKLHTRNSVESPEAAELSHVTTSVSPKGVAYTVRPDIAAMTILQIQYF